LPQRPQFDESFTKVAVLTHRPPHHSSKGSQFQGGLLLVLGGLPVVGGFPVIFGQEGESNINEKSNDSRMTGRRMTAFGNSLDRR
jgi:hypothetical protein